jgi:metallo-beta-lactamase family protein
MRRMNLAITHHGALRGVTGSCHELTLPDGSAVLIDCGLFQGAETSPDGAHAQNLEIDFPIQHVRALILTHVHIDHAGRIPHLLAAGFQGPIITSEASAHLLPMVLEDALEVGFTRDRALIERVIGRIRAQTVALPYKRWHPVIPSAPASPAPERPAPASPAPGKPTLQCRLSPAGHILGSAYVELEVTHNEEKQRIVFSGDLGAPYTPLLPAPKSPDRADVLVIESTYGDRLHEGRRERRQKLQEICEHAFGNRGTLLIPAFSIGRTQELLYELEETIHRNRAQPAAQGVPWDELDIIVDSPLAADLTAGYAQLKQHWDKEARRKLAAGRHPLAFESLTTIADHATHLRTVAYLAKTARPAIVIAASGMCGGGRIVNYLKAMLIDPRHDVLFCGYQAAGTPGRAIQSYGPTGGYVDLEGERIDIRAGIHTLGGFSAHADQKDLLNFVGRMRTPPRQVRIVHGDDAAKATLAALLKKRHPAIEVVIPT